MTPGDLSCMRHQTCACRRAWRARLPLMLLAVTLAALTPGRARADAPAAESAVLASPVPLAAAAAIDARLAAMHTVERAVEGVSPEGAMATAYLSKDHGLEKIEVVALGERGRDRFDFYWHGAQLLAARSRHIDYGAMITAIPTDQPLPMTLTRDDAVEYQGHRMHRWFQDGAGQPVGSKDAVGLAGALAAKARSFRRLMLTPAAEGAASCQWQCADDWIGECRRFVCR